jgi:UDPglucose 6-dehydrogenase
MTALAGPTGFLGLSHLGIVSSTGWASLGQPVAAVDLDPAPVAALGQGEVPVHEPGLDALLGRHRARMTFSTDPAALAACPLVVIARDVPTDHDNAADPSVVQDLVDAALPHLQPRVTLVLMSQVSPGFTRRLGMRIRARRPDLAFRLYYWVETLVFGRAVERYLSPERIIIGCDDPAAPFPLELDDGLRRFGCPIIPMTYESAELTKAAINLYLCAAVTYANTLSDLCEAVGADWSEMAPALRLDPRIGSAAYIRPGLGIGGGNLERDMTTLRDLCDDTTVDAAFIQTMIDYNRRRFRWVHRKLEAHVFQAGSHPLIAVWGLAYKKNTRSTKNSLALRVIDSLRGRAEVHAWDPLVRASDVDVPAKIVGDRDEALDGADCLLILTDWDEFRLPAAAAVASMRRPVVIDCVGVVDQARADLGGVHYLRIGRGLPR